MPCTFYDMDYAEIIPHLEGKMALADAVELIKINTRRFAKAQRTWVQALHPNGVVDIRPDLTAEEITTEWMEQKGSLWSPSPK